MSKTRLAITVTILGSLATPSTALSAGDGIPPLPEAPAQTSPTLLPDSAAAPPLDVLVEELLQKNPRLAAARRRAEAAEAATGRYRGLMPPEVGVDFSSAPLSSFPNPIRGQEETRFFVRQAFPFPGKLAAMTRAQRLEAAMAGNEAESEADQAIRELQETYYDLYALQRMLDVNAESGALWGKSIAIARAQYEVGRGMLPDILSAQTELAQLGSRRQLLEQRAAAARAELNALLDRPVDQPLGRIPDPRADSLALDLEALTGLALRNRPGLRATEQAVEMSRARASAAKRDYLPDIMVEGMYMDMEGVMADGNRWGVMVGITAPVAPWSLPRIRASLEQERLETRRAEAAARDMRNRTRVHVHQALMKIRANREVVRNLESTILPQAGQALESVNAAYQSGNADFLRLLEANRSLLMAREEYYAAKMGLMQSRAELEQAVGLPMRRIRESLDAERPEAAGTEKREEESP